MNSDPAERGAGPTRRLLVTLVSTVCRWPRTVLVCSLALCVLSVVAAAARLQYHTSRNDLLSPDKDYQKRWQQYLAEFGDDDDIVVVVRGGRSPADEGSRRSRGRHEYASSRELFDRLFYKADLRHLRNRALLLLPEDEIEAIRRHISSDDMTHAARHRVAGMAGCRHQRLVDRGSGPTNGARNRAQPLSQGRRGVLRPAPGRRPGREGDARRSEELRQSVGRRGAGTCDGQTDYLAEPQYFFSGDGTLAFLLVRPVKEARFVHRRPEKRRGDARHRRRRSARTIRTWSSA